MISADDVHGRPHISPKPGRTERVDLRVSHFGDRGAWMIEMASARARLWAQSSLNCDRYDRRRDTVRVDAEGANSIIQRARFAGLVCESPGPEDCLDF